MINCQTYDLPNEEEAIVLARAIQLIGQKDYEAAKQVLIARHDKLIEKPKLRLYGL